MLIGAMNHPAYDLFEEIRWMAALGMEFLDLTLEPPAAASWNVDRRRLREILREYHLPVVGHTAWYLPLASAIPEIRQGAVAELRRCMEVFSELGAKWMNIHPDRHTPWHDRHFYIQGNLESLYELQKHGERLGVGLMIENLPGTYNSVEQLGELLDPLPELKLHLDVGHANLEVPENTTPEILDAYRDRLRHVHLHDNRGGNADLHLPLGAGTLDVERMVGLLKRCGYDGTITLEVFTPDKHHLIYSRDVLRRIWGGSSVALAS